MKIILITSIIISSNSYIILIAEDNNNFDFSKNELCYGYIIPLPSGKDSTHETFQNSKVRFLVNDLLRENKTKWLNSKEITKILDISIGSVTNCLRKLRESGAVKFKESGHRNQFEYQFKK